ncbi:hypothetical protein TNCV_1715191 [Trichonephila clavipes]|nr:hypothetical protein TNCV_1715191 [Trichonephila clavipes]
MGFDWVIPGMGTAEDSNQTLILRTDDGGKPNRLAVIIEHLLVPEAAPTQSLPFDSNAVGACVLQVWSSGSCSILQLSVSSKRCEQTLKRPAQANILSDTNKKNEAAIRKSVISGTKLSTKFASYTRDVLLERTERAIAIWIEEQVQRRIPVSGYLIQEKALNETVRTINFHFPS